MKIKMKETIQAIIESPKGTTQKFDYDPKTGSYILTKQLPIGMSFPFDFGFIPGTVGQDGDPLDIMVLGDAPTFTGCQINCRIIGNLVCEQTETDGKKVRNDRYIAITDISEIYGKAKTLSELPTNILAELESFFVNYNAQAGKIFKVIKRTGSKAALKEIDRSCTNNLKTTRLEIFLPLSNEAGKAFPRKFYQNLEDELADKFGGLTSYSRVPVEGFWQPGEKCTSQPMLIYELLLSALDLDYWTKTKTRLEKQFSQEEILITHSTASKI